MLSPAQRETHDYERTFYICILLLPHATPLGRIERGYIVQIVFFCVYLIRSSNFDQYGNAHVHPSSNHPLLPLQPNELNKLSTRSSLGSSFLCAKKLEIRYQSTASSLLLQRVVRSV